MGTVFKKWWVILIQGILLIIIAFIFFNHPAEVLTVISMWVGILTLMAGIGGLLAHFMGSKEERDSTSLLWSILTLLFGFLMLTKIIITMKVITVMFGLWILFTGIWLLAAWREHRKGGSLGWILLIGGILSILAGLAIMFNMYTGAVWISTLLGIQAFIAGIALIILAFVKRKVVNKVKSAFR